MRTSWEDAMTESEEESSLYGELENLYPDITVNFSRGEFTSPPVWDESTVQMYISEITFTRS